MRGQTLSWQEQLDNDFFSQNTTQIDNTITQIDLFESATNDIFFLVSYLLNTTSQHTHDCMCAFMPDSNWEKYQMIREASSFEKLNLNKIRNYFFKIWLLDLNPGPSKWNVLTILNQPL